MLALAFVVVHPSAQVRVGLVHAPNARCVPARTGLDSQAEDVEAMTKRKAQEKQKLMLLLREAEDEQAALVAANKE